MIKVGPFFYLEKSINGMQGIYADPIDHQDAENICEKLGNPISHETLFDRLRSDIDYIEIPRGRVVYDVTKKEAVVYIDRCIEQHADKFADAFMLERFRIEYDEHYVCPSCWDREKMWE